MTATPAANVGRIVHYWPTQQGHHAPWAAIITGLWNIEERTVRLHIFAPYGCAEDPIPEDGAYPYAETPTAGHWSWPPRA